MHIFSYLCLIRHILMIFYVILSSRVLFVCLNRGIMHNALSLSRLMNNRCGLTCLDPGGGLHSY